MPTHSRTIDYLKSHDSLGRRVRNLETGVHPTTADTTYWDDTNWQLLELEPAWRHAFEGLVDMQLMWRRRLGIVHLRGGVRPASAADWNMIDEPGVDPDPARGSLITTLPADARPREDTTLIGLLFDRGDMVPVRLHASGQLRLYKMSGDDYTGTVSFQGQSWTTQ